MATKFIDFYFDLGSTNSYFALKLLQPLTHKYQAQIVWHPFNLGHVFKQNNYILMDEPKAKMRNRKADLMRWARKYDLPFNVPDNFPMKTSNALKACIVMKRFELQAEFVNAIFEAYWENNQGNIADYASLSKIALDLDSKEHQFTSDEFVALCESQETRQALIDSTTNAQTRGIFGAPTIAIDDAIYWGKDRFDFIEDHLNGKAW